jgi:hypothetical protein
MAQRKIRINDRTTPVPHPAPAYMASPVDAKAAADRRTKANRTAALRKAVIAKSRSYRVPQPIRDDIGLTRDEILASAPVLAAAVRPLPPADPLPPHWRKYFAQCCRYAQAIQYRHRLATKHDLPSDWWDIPPRGGLSDVINAVFLDVDAVSTILNIPSTSASRLMSSGLIPSFKGPSLPLMTTVHDLTIYLSMNRLIDWRVVMYQAGWKAGLGGLWRDPSTGDYIPLTAALAKVKSQVDVKFGAKLA